MKNGSQSNRICMHHVSPIKPWRQFSERHPLHSTWASWSKPNLDTPSIIAHLVISSVFSRDFFWARKFKWNSVDFWDRWNRIFWGQFQFPFEIVKRRREHNSLMVLLFQDAKHPRCVGDLEVLLRSMSFTLFFSRQIMMIAFHPSRQLFHIRRTTESTSKEGPNMTPHLSWKIHSHPSSLPKVHFFTVFENYPKILILHIHLWNLGQFFFDP